MLALFVIACFQISLGAALPLYLQVLASVVVLLELYHEHLKFQRIHSASSLTIEGLTQDTLAEVAEGERVEEYIRSLHWSPHTTDEDRTLVAGNIRAFYGWLKREGRSNG